MAYRCKLSYETDPLCRSVPFCEGERSAKRYPSAVRFETPICRHIKVITEYTILVPCIKGSGQSIVAFNERGGRKVV